MIFMFSPSTTLFSLRAGRLEFIPSRGYFLFATASRPALGLTQPPV